MPFYLFMILSVIFGFVRAPEEGGEFFIVTFHGDEGEAVKESVLRVPSSGSIGSGKRKHNHDGDTPPPDTSPQKRRNTLVVEDNAPGVEDKKLGGFVIIDQPY